MKNFLTWLAILVSSIFFEVNATTQDFDGRWDIVATCGVNLGNGRPGFTTKTQWTVTNGKSLFVQKGNTALGRDETTWNFIVNKAQATVDAIGRRDNGDTWEWKLNSKSIQSEKITLTGAMLSDVKKVRDCDIEMTRLKVVAVAPAEKIVVTPSPATSEIAAQKAPEIIQTTAQPLNSLTPLENVVETVANNPLLDIVVLASTKKRDVVKRSIDGNWLIDGNKVCIDIGPLVEGLGSAIPLKFFHEITVGRKDIPNEIRPLKFYQMLSYFPAKDDAPSSNKKSGWNGPTPVASSGVTAQPKTETGLSKIAALHSRLADALEAGFAKKFGKQITVYYVTGGTGCKPDAYAVPRAYMDIKVGSTINDGKWRNNIDRGDLFELVSVPVSIFRQVIAENTASIQKKNQETEAFLLKMDQSPVNGEMAVYSAINIGRGRVDACSVEPSEQNAPRFDVPLEALLQTELFKKFLPARSSTHTRFKSMDALYSDLQLPNGTCTVILGNGPSIAKLKKALDRDTKLDARLMTQTVTEAQLIDAHAKALGFESTESYFFARSTGIQDVALVSQLERLGVHTNEQYQFALKRLNDAGLEDPQTVKGLISFLTDEKEAAAQSTSIKKLRAERLARELAALRQQAQAQSAADKKKAAEFPYVATISCMIGMQKTSLQACMSSKSIQTEIELKNGSVYRMYKMFDVTDIGDWNGQEMVVDLRSNFELKAQNADATLTLNVVIKRRSTGDIIFQKSAAQFGVIAVKN